jgi:hypothetical protein
VSVFFSERIWPQLVANELFSKLEANGAEIDKTGKLNAVLIPIKDETSIMIAIKTVNFKKNIK